MYTDNRMCIMSTPSMDLVSLGLVSEAHMTLPGALSSADRCRVHPLSLSQEHQRGRKLRIKQGRERKWCEPGGVLTRWGCVGGSKAELMNRENVSRHFSIASPTASVSQRG